VEGEVELKIERWEMGGSFNSMWSREREGEAEVQSLEFRGFGSVWREDRNKWTF
jgi:hypothetical protein